MRRFTWSKETFDGDFTDGPRSATEMTRRVQMCSAVLGRFEFVYFVPEECSTFLDDLKGFNPAVFIPVIVIAFRKIRISQSFRITKIFSSSMKMTTRGLGLRLILSRSCGNNTNRSVFARIFYSNYLDERRTSGTGWRLANEWSNC